MVKFNLFFVCLMIIVCGCSQPVQSPSGVKMMKTGKLTTDSSGFTNEQRNIKHKIQTDSNSETIWYVYVISPYDRKIVIQSTSKGKVTSSNKRLTPRSISSTDRGLSFHIGESLYVTDEVPAEDGTFGSSSEYIYWVDDKGRNHRHYLTGGQILHIVDAKMTLDELMGVIN